MSHLTILVTILCMALVTIAIRIFPLWFLAGRELPPWFVLWLKYVPVSILAAMLAPELLHRKGQFDFSSGNLYLWVAIPIFALGIATRSVFVPVLTGMAGIALVRYFIGG